MNNNTYSRAFRRHLWMMDSFSESESIWQPWSSWFHWGKLPIKPPQTENEVEDDDITTYKKPPSVFMLYVANAALDWYLCGQWWATCLGQGLYKRYYAVQWVTKQTHRLYRWVRDIPSEPETIPWISVNQLVEKGHYTLTTRTTDEIHVIHSLQLKEDYVMCLDCTLPENVKDRWERVTQQQRQQQPTQHMVGRALWMYKNAQGMYHIRMGYSGDQMLMEHVSNPIPSTVRFLSIEYSHPSMTHTIPLEIHTNMLLVGNCLFFPAFVARMLRYKSCESYGDNHQSYVFDLDYTLRIMDKNLQYLELSSNQYVQLNTTDYEIVKENE